MRPFGLRLSILCVEGCERLDLLLAKPAGDRDHGDIAADAVPVFLESADEVVVGEVVEAGDPLPVPAMAGDAGAGQVRPVRRITFRFDGMRGYKDGHEDRQKGGDWG